MSKKPIINNYLKEEWYRPHMQYQQEEILTSFGRMPRYRIYALDEDYKPAQFVGMEDSPIGLYSLVDTINGARDIIETIEAESYDEAYDTLSKLIITEEEEE